jgi:hypothetical protein
MICIHCGLPATSDCVNHQQTALPRAAKKAVEKKRDPSQDTSIHPRVRNGRTVFQKSNTAKPKRTK